MNYIPCSKMLLQHREVTKLCTMRLEDCDGLHIGDGEIKCPIRTTYHGGTCDITLQPTADHTFTAVRYGMRPRVAIYEGDVAIAYFPVGVSMYKDCTLRFTAG